MIVESLVIDGVAVDKCFLNSVVLEQSIYKSVIYGKIVFNDSYFQYEKETFPGDIVTMKIKDMSEGVEKFAEVKFSVYALQEEKPLKETLYYEVLICSTFAYDIYSSKITGNYKNTLISDIVKNLLLKSDIKKFEIETTSNKLDYALPLWSVANHVKYLNRFALSENGGGGYLLFPELDGKMNYMSRDCLLKKRRFEDTLAVLSDDAIGYPGNITSLNLEKEVDILKMLELGASQLRVTSFNGNTSNLEKSTFSLKDIKRERMMTNYPFPKSGFASGENIYINNSSEEECEAILKNKIIRLLDPLVLNVTIPGSLKFRIGSVIGVAYPTVSSSESMDMKKSGAYLIQSLVTHLDVQNNSCMQVLSCVTDGYNITKLKGLI